MKRWATLACWALLLAATLFSSLPLLLQRRSLQDRVVNFVEQSLGVEVQVGAIGWQWLPVPALTLRTLKVESEAFALAAPETDLVINPGVLLTALPGLHWSREERPLRIRRPLFSARLIEPDLTFKRHGWGAAIPIGHLGIVNGRLHLPGQALGHGLTTKAITLTAVNGSFASSAHQLKINIRAGSDFARGFSLKGRLDLVHGSFAAEATAEGLESSRLFSEPAAASPWLPVVQGLTLTAHLKGEARDRFRLQLAAPRSPCSLTIKGQTLQVASLAALTMTRQGDDLAIAVDGAALTAPRLSVSGHVGRSLPDQDPAAGPKWSIDLQGTDLDLGAIRTQILALFGQHPVAQKVCTIVGGGTAATARYAFTGRVADFQHLQSMGIWAEARDIPITIPNLGLVLDRASGPIAIIDGRLTGQGLTATLGQSQGENGDLLLDLETERHGFTLDLDLNADLNDLQDVLSRIIPSPRFQEELRHFVSVRGRAQGHLSLGDDLRQVETRVSVESMAATGTYDRLPWPFTIKAGQLGISPHHLDWQGVQGTLGGHRISDSKGEVTWKGAIRLDLQGVEADLDLHSLLEEGTLRTNLQTYAIRDLVAGRFDTITGRARLRRTTLAGPIAQPAAWRYHTAIKASDLTVTAQGVPDLRSPEVEAEISEERADFAGLFGILEQGVFEQKLFLGGHYGHRLLTGWQGDLEINGDVGDEMGQWLKGKELIPALAFPKPPFRLEKFTISNQGPGFATSLARGTIMALPPARAAAVQVTLSRTPDRIDDTITFVKGEKQGTLHYQTWPGQEGRTLFDWQGELDFETLDALFPQRLVQGGTLNGSFSRRVDQGITLYSGTLTAAGVRFGPQSLAPGLTLNALRLQGEEEVILVRQADLDLAGAPATFTGQISGRGGGHAVDLRLTAPKLSWESIRQAFSKKGDRSIFAGPAKIDLSPFLLRGSITLDIGAFDYTRQPTPEGPAEGEKGGHTFTVSPFKGTLTLDASGLALHCNQGTLCGINGQGSWHFGEMGGEDSITFASGQTPLSFAQALPCLGIKQGLITGPFTVAGEIKGRPNKWRQGHITLTSKEGLIKRMTLLSKIFTAVNFTDLFTWQDLPDMEEGLPYNDLAVNGHIENNHLILDRTIVKGKGVNLSGRGTIDLGDLNADLTFFIAPFKMVDSVVSNIPLLGKALAGPKESILTFPVTVTGNLKDPEVTALAPEAVGSATLELFRDTLTLPFRLFQQGEENSGLEPPSPAPPRGDDLNGHYPH